MLSLQGEWVRFPGRGTKILHATWHSQKVEKIKKKRDIISVWDDGFICGIPKQMTDNEPDLKKNSGLESECL